MEALIGPHWEFITASYVAAILVIGGLIAWVLIDGREQRQLLDLAEPQDRNHDHKEATGRVGDAS